MIEKRFWWVFLASLLAIYLVILAGSIVRMTGSGMGCPDWPKCFNQWIPPTDVSQLPENYRDIFLNKRKAKINKYTKFLNRIGMSEVSEALTKDPDLLKEEPFIANKTWIEYVNRLMGFLAGNFLILGFIMSLFLSQKKKSYVFLSFLALLLTSIQGWFGSIVVTSNLTPWTISFHMFFALLIIAVIIHLLYTIKPSRKINVSGLTLFSILLLILSLIQIYFGTQVRQEIDVLVKTDIMRRDWIHSLSSIFEIHRSFAIAVILLHFYLLRKLWTDSNWRMFGIIMLVILLLEVFSGIVMAYFSIPKFAQPVHLFLATILFGMQYWLILHIGNGKLNLEKSNDGLKKL